jgi:hypothetical protein
MNLKYLINSKELKEFTIKCLDNDCFQKCRNAFLEILNKSNTVKEFADEFLSRKDLREYQGYWELAKDYLGVQDTRILAEKYLEDEDLIQGNHIRHAKTVSDIGSIKVGNDSFSVGISNKYGDCYDNMVYVIEKKVSNINLDFAKFVTSIEGTEMYIYDYDCGDDKVIKLEGKRYGVYAMEKLVIFEKWN